MVQCIVQSFLAATRQLYQWQLVTSSTIPYTYQLVILTTQSDVHTVMQLYRLLSSPFLKVCDCADYSAILRDPKPFDSGDCHFNDCLKFRAFKHKLYHTSIAAILCPLRPGMTAPVVRRCPDGHFRRVIYDLIAFIADYPEQVMLTGIVQRWCPK